MILPGHGGRRRGAAALAPQPTWNPSDKSTTVVLSNGNRTASNSSETAVNAAVRALGAKSAGKWYFETIAGASTTAASQGLLTAAATLAQTYIGSDANGYGYFSGSVYRSGAILASGQPTWAAGARLMFAVDFDALKMWVGANGVWGGDPVAGTGGFSIVAGTYHIACAPRQSTVSIQIPAELAYAPPATFTPWAEPAAAPIVGGSGPVPENTAAPVLSSADLTVGTVATCTPGSWTNSPTGYLYQFKLDGTNVGGNTATNTYTFQAGDVAKTLTCVVTAMNANGPSTATSNGRGPIAAVVVPPEETGWTPAALGSRLYAWWDFGDASKITLAENGSDVVSVALKAGTAGVLPLQGYHDGFDSWRPIVDANVFNGKPSIRMRNAARPGVIFTEAINIASNALAYYTSMYLTAGQWQGRIASFAPLSAWDDGSQQGFMMHTTGSTVELYRDNFGGANGWTDQYPGAHAYNARFPSTGNGYMDREYLQGEGVVNAAAAPFAVRRFAIGGAAADKYNCHLAAHGYARHGIIVVGDLTLDEQRRLVAFLAWDGGYQSELPASNPYKNAPPT